MKKYLSLGAAFIAALTLGACSSHSSNTAVNQQVTKDSAAAQQIVTGCLKHGSLSTAHGRKTIITCIAPPGHTVQFEACAQNVLVHNIGVPTPGTEAHITSALSQCVVKDR
jgi:hypothetical protein